MTATAPTTVTATTVGAPVDAGTATRQLCAAMLRDAGLRERFLDALDGNLVNGIGVSPGVDLEVVARYALAAERWRERRDFALLAALVGGLIALTAGSSAGSVANGIAIALPFVLLAWAIVTAERMAARLVVGRHLLPGAVDPGAEPPAVPPGWSHRLAALQTGQKGNVTVYSGFSPFVGSGSIIGSWSFAINLQRAKENGDAPRAIDVGELYDCVAAHISELGLANITIEDRLLVDGRGIRHDPRFLPAWDARPRSSVSDELVEQVRDRPERAVRHYRCIRVVDWDGELVLSMFLNFTKLSHMLFAEAHYLLLPPLEPKLRAVDDLRARPRADEVVAVLIESALVTPFATAMSPRRVLAGIVEQITDRRGDELLKLVERTPSYDYGARPSIREELAGGYARYLQRVDKDMYLKVIEREVFDSLVDFLDDRGVDVSELRDRQNTILNYGVMANSVEAHNVVAGGKVTADLRRVVGAGSPGARSRDGDG